MFFAGMALGAVAGTAFGIGMMCCVVAGKQEDQQMELLWSSFFVTLRAKKILL